MIEFFKNDAGVTMELEDLVSLIEHDLLDRIVDIIISLESGTLDKEHMTPYYMKRLLGLGDSDN
jgi:hypothetical protein